MRCLYCGKELALLKRLRGGGEFCSDAHRQQYQDEYNQLALTRLLQAQPTEDRQTRPSLVSGVESSAEGRTGSELRERNAVINRVTSNDNRPAQDLPARTALNAPAREQRQIEAPSAQAKGPAKSQAEKAQADLQASLLARLEEANQEPPPPPRRVAPPKPAPPTPEPEEKAPAPLFGFLVEAPPPIEPDAFTCSVELEQLWNLTPALPENDLAIEAEERIPELAGAVRFGISDGVDSHTARTRNVEQRDFSHTVRAATTLFANRVDGGLARYQDPLEIEMSPCAPQTNAAPWLAPPRPYGAPEIELGGLARLKFTSVGFVEEVPEVEPELVAWPYEPDAEPETEPEPVPVARLEPQAKAAPAPAFVEFVEDPLPAAASEEFVGVPVEVKPERPVEAAAVTAVKAAKPVEPVKPEKAVEAKPVNAAPSVEPPPPARQTQSLAVSIETLAAVRGRPLQVFSQPLVAQPEIQIPVSGPMPLRPVMVIAPGPAAPAPVAAAPTPVAAPAPVEAPVPVAAPVHAMDEPPAPVVQNRAKESQTSRPEVPRNMPKESAKPVEAEKPVVEQRNGSRERPVLVRSQGQNQKPQQQSEKQPEKQAEKQPEKQADGNRNERERNKIAQRPRTEDRKPGKAAGSLSLRQEPAAEVESSAPVAEEKPLPKPIAAPLTDLDLGLPALHMEQQQGFWGRLSTVGKIGLAAGVVVVATGATYMISGGHAAATPPTTNAPRERQSVAAGTPITDASWMADWSPDAARRGRHISILKSSLPLSDYRMQFEAQIESKAIGWVYRAMDPLNFHVAKIEVVKPGLEPIVALVRFAVVKGVDQPRSTTTIPIKVRVDTLYKIRFEALGNRFSTWIGDQKIGEWNDDRFTSGPPGLFNDRGESAVMGQVNVINLK